MGFWIFMLFSDLLIPAVMLLFGLRFRKRPPEKIQASFGYRTRRSMKSKTAWDYAHRYFGTVWLAVGAILLPVSVLVMLSVLGKPEQQISEAGLLLCGGQLLVLLLSLIPTELALKKKFGT